MGPALATYTAVLFSNTAVPTWHEAHRHLPVLFGSSAAAAGGGFGLIFASTADNVPAARLAVAGAVVELATEQKMTQDLGMLADVYEKGRAKTLMTVSKACLVAGAVGAVVGRKKRWSAALSGLALLAGSALTRFGVFDAGIASANDPAHIVVPQRERIRRREEAARPGRRRPTGTTSLLRGPELRPVRAAGTRVRPARTARSSPSSGTNGPFVPARTCPVRRTGPRRGSWTA